MDTINQTLPKLEQIIIIPTVVRLTAKHTIEEQMLKGYFLEIPYAGTANEMLLPNIEPCTNNPILVEITNYLKKRIKAQALERRSVICVSPVKRFR